MSTILTKFSVVSLPRTGTMSISKMLMQLGLTVSHAPGPAFYQGYLGRFDALSDTPCFRPSAIEWCMGQSPDMKFIYIEKDPMDWFKSMVKIGLSENYNSMLVQYEQDAVGMGVHSLCDVESLLEVLGGKFNRARAVNKFAEHRAKVMDLIPADRLLVYSFDDGWRPLAEFVGEEPPADLEVPHLNKDTMFDSLS